MSRPSPFIAAKLQELLDERESLRIKISLADDLPGFAENIMNMRYRVVQLDRAIINHRAAPDA